MPHSATGQRVSGKMPRCGLKINPPPWQDPSATAKSYGCDALDRRLPTQAAPEDREQKWKVEVQVKPKKGEGQGGPGYHWGDFIAEIPRERPVSTPPRVPRIWHSGLVQKQVTVSVVPGCQKMSKNSLQRQGLERRGPWHSRQGQSSQLNASNRIKQ
jgi:hypothetical protein